MIAKFSHISCNRSKDHEPTTGSKQSHSVEPNLMNSEILKNWEPEEIRESQLNDKNKLNTYTTVYQIKKEKPNWNQVSPIKIEGQKTQWATVVTLTCYRVVAHSGSLFSSVFLS
jgi:hypothetical protein